MDPLLIAVIALGALLLTTLLLLASARGARRTARRSLFATQTDLMATRQSLQSVKLGEREAAWAADRSSRRLERLTLDLTKAQHEAGRLEADLDDLRTRLGAADREIERIRSDHATAESRIAELDIEMAQLRLESDRIEGVEQRLTSVVRERDRLAASAQRSEQLEDELAALGRIHQELSVLREENAVLRAGLVAPASTLAAEGELVSDIHGEVAALRRQMAQDQAEADRRVAAAEADAAAARQYLDDLQSKGQVSTASTTAAVADLEEKLAAVTAARTAEQQTSAQRIASLERLHVDIAERDRQIARLEATIADVGASTSAGQVDSEAEPTASDPASYAQWDATLRERVGRAVADATSRLEKEVAHLRLVIGEKERLLAARSQAPIPPKPRKPLTITAIRGIGPVIAGILAGHGITTLEDVSALTEADIDRLSQDMPVYPDRIRVDDWVGQARALLS